MQLTLVILLVSIPSVISLKCYVCNSNELKTCASESNLNSFIKTCKQTVEPYCRKIEQTVDKETSIIRTCGSKTEAKSCYKTAGLNNAFVCSCNTDLCNHAKSVNPQQRIITIFSSIIVLGITMILLS